MQRLCHRSIPTVSMPHRILSKGGLARSQVERDFPATAATPGGAMWLLFPVPPDWGQLVRFLHGVRHRPPPLIEIPLPPVWSWGRCSYGRRTQCHPWGVLPLTMLVGLTPTSTLQESCRHVNVSAVLVVAWVGIRVPLPLPCNRPQVEHVQESLHGSFVPRNT